MRKTSIRIGTLNIGTLNGKSRELVDLMQRKRVNILCLQETRWKGNKAKELGEGYKLFVSGANKGGKNGVVRLCVCMLLSQGSGEEKTNFWTDLDQIIMCVPMNERLICGGNLNGHVGKRKNVVGRVLGRWSVGERLVDHAVAFDLVLVNTYFEKKANQLVTYMSGGRSSQIDFFLCHRRHLREVRNSKVLNGESVAAQHRVLPVDCDFFIDYYDVQTCWLLNSNCILKVGEEVLEKTSGKRLPEGKELWWWNAEVQAIVKQKKEAKKRWDLMGRPEDKETYHFANKMTKKAVAIAKAKALEEAYKVFERKGGKRQLMRIAKARDKASKDFTSIKLIKDDKGVVLQDYERVKERLKEYFRNLLNEENPRTVYENGEANEGVVQDISREEVESVLRKMKMEKAVGTDWIPVEAWRGLGKEGIDILWDLMKKLWQQEKIPDKWRKSILVLIFKGKGMHRTEEITEVYSYCPIL
ncbi:uncharacterized protein [Centruroides vittatus]|uniref:uncharacterized protein n=1 Tax=Centruroides vittatus TaxID=120091 RepID=UPI00350E921B